MDLAYALSDNYQLYTLHLCTTKESLCVDVGILSHVMSTVERVSDLRVSRRATDSLCLTTMDDEDPIAQFFPGEDSVDLYAVLSLKSDAKLDDIKKSYRRHALIYHPDKHAASTDTVKADASTKFQQIGFAYAVLGDEKRRARYDMTGKTDEGFEMVAGEDGWEAYFEEMFERVTRGKLDEMKKAYQGHLYSFVRHVEAYLIRYRLF